MKDEMPERPAIVTALHAQDRLLTPTAGAPKGYRRIDRLRWLKDHGAIGDHQLHAGRRLQEDWQISKLENATSMQLGGRGAGWHAFGREAGCRGAREEGAGRAAA
jgi:hypothetical protein